MTFHSIVLFIALFYVLNMYSSIVMNDQKGDIRKLT